MSEDALLGAVLDLCRLLGLHTAHFRPGRTARGWATAVQGDGKGFPDLVVVGPGGVLWVELKSRRGRLSGEQERWCSWLGAAGQEYRVWRPEDLVSGRVQRELASLRSR